MESNSPTNVAGNALIQNEQGDIVAIVTDINDKNKAQEPNHNDVPTTTTNTNPDLTVIPPLIVEPASEDKQIVENNQNSDYSNPKQEKIEQDENVNTNNCDPANMYVNSDAPKQSRWNKENRIMLKQLMGSLPPHDIGAALRVILDTFGVESSKLIRRGDYIELDLIEISDDYILDSLWNYCAQMQYNIMSTLQMQQQQQQLHYQQQMQQVHHIPPQHAVPVQVMQQHQHQQHQYVPPSISTPTHNMPQLDNQNMNHNHNHNIQ